MNFIKAFSLIERIFLKLRLRVQNAEFLSKELETRILKIKTEKLRKRIRGE